MWYTLCICVRYVSNICVVYTVHLSPRESRCSGPQVRQIQLSPNRHHLGFRFQMFPPWQGEEQDYGSGTQDQKGGGTYKGQPPFQRVAQPHTRYQAGPGFLQQENQDITVSGPLSQENQAGPLQQENQDITVSPMAFRASCIKFSKLSFHQIVTTWILDDKCSVLSRGRNKSRNMNMGLGFRTKKGQAWKRTAHSQSHAPTD